MMKTGLRLIGAYSLILCLAFIASFVLKWISGLIYADSWIHSGDVSIEYGKVQGLLYRDELIWYTAMFLVLVTIWILKKESHDFAQSKLHYFLASKKINMMAGALFIFTALGLPLSKGNPDPVGTSLGLFNLTMIGLIFVRFVAKEVFLWTRADHQ